MLGKEDAILDHVYDVTGGLCENNDKFAIERSLPEIQIGDIVAIHDTGAHGFSMGYNYNGKAPFRGGSAERGRQLPAHPPRRDAGGLFRDLRFF